jgi:hypothetical protein
MKKSSRYAVLVGLLIGVAVVMGYAVTEWWVPNRKMADPAWWEQANADDVRRVSHKVLRFPVGNHHDAFLALAKVGNAESVPLIIDALQWQDINPKGDFEECSVSHAFEALRSLTGQDLGMERESWEAWWRDTGVKLPASDFYPRGGADAGSPGTQ